jgi:hypothetical protein
VDISAVNETPFYSKGMTSPFVHSLEAIPQRAPNAVVSAALWETFILLLTSFSSFPRQGALWFCLNSGCFALLVQADEGFDESLELMLALWHS